MTFFTDDLHSIFSFLPLSDISSSSAVCRRWSSAVSSEPPRAARCDVRSAEELRDLATSNLRRHVQTLDLTSSLLMIDDLPELICRRITSITHLICTVDLHRLAGLQFPVGLRTLEVKIIGPGPIEDEWHNLSVLLSCAARVPLTSLRISPEWASDRLPSASAMEPLRHLRATLTELMFHRPLGDARWTADHFALFRALPHLTRLDLTAPRSASDCSSWHDEELQLLTADPAPTHLQSLGCRLTEVSSRSLVAISRLPSLTELEICLLRPADELIDVSVLGRLPRLARLHIDVNEQADATPVIDALKQCTAITHLTLEGVRQMTDAHLGDLLPSLTRLRRLELHLLDELDDLSCLSAASKLADTLEHLTITGTFVPHHTLMRLRSLRRLQSAEMQIVRRRTTRSTGDTRDEHHSDPEALFLPMMADLRIVISGEGDVDLRGMLGRLPRLRVVHLECEIGIAVPPLVQFLTHAPALTTLQWKHPAVTDADLCTLMPSLPHLRELHLSRLSLTSLRFASCSAHLAISLETLVIVEPDTAHSLRVNELVHLRSLRALRRLQLVLMMSRAECPLADAPPMPHRPIASDADSDSGGASSLASLTSLDLIVCTPYSDLLDSIDSIDLSLLGPMPRLTTCVLDLHPTVKAATIAPALMHSTQLDELRIVHPALTDSHLAELMPHLLHLSSLNVQSRSRLGGLAFASVAVAPRLAQTLTQLIVRTSDTTPEPTINLHHLRALANLTALSLHFPRARGAASDAGIEEMTITSPHFRRDAWPRLRYSRVECD